LKKSNSGRTAASFGSLLAGAFFLAAGCVTKTIEPEYNPRVFTVQDNDGKVTISWSSRSDYNYRVFIKNPETQMLEPLPGMDLISGTGEIISVYDKRRRKQPLPWYRVRPEKK
jgi:hypothetical protein